MSWVWGCPKRPIFATGNEILFSFFIRIEKRKYFLAARGEGGLLRQSRFQTRRYGATVGFSFAMRKVIAIPLKKA
ncbi:MAG: hypothetical protein IPN20_24195 [Haliscomenobacter sp.]|nr:hypothetical protein [Haliscomenobacter sp.]